MLVTSCGVPVKAVEYPLQAVEYPLLAVEYQASGNHQLFSLHFLGREPGNDSTVFL